MYAIKPAISSAGFIDQRETGIDDFAEIVRWNIGRHAHRDTRRTIDQQGRYAGRHDHRLALGTVVVFGEIDGFLVEIGQHFVRDLRHTHFGITHRGRRVAIDRTKVTLAIDQHVTQGERLRHTHDGVVHRGVAVGVVFTDHVTDHTRGFFIGFVVVITEHTHGVKHTPMYRFQAVANVGQSTANDDAHGVAKIRLTHLVFQVDRGNFFCEFRHLERKPGSLESLLNYYCGLATEPGIVPHTGTAKHLVRNKYLVFRAIKN
jgi:hypothetical protein